MLSVGGAANSIMYECRNQLNTRWLATEAGDDPAEFHFDSDKCVLIATKASLHEMILPGTMAILCPLFVGLMLGQNGLFGLLCGAISSGSLLAITFSNTGGAWDNAKKWVEKGALGPGKGKHSAAHMAVVVGDTVGDPLKDTTGPSLNILIKLLSILALMMQPLIDRYAWVHWGQACVLLVVGLIGVYLIFKISPPAGFSPEKKAAIDATARRRKGLDEQGNQVRAMRPEDSLAMSLSDEFLRGDHSLGNGAAESEEKTKDARDILEELEASGATPGGSFGTSELGYQSGDNRSYGRVLELSGSEGHRESFY